MLRHVNVVWAFGPQVKCLIIGCLLKLVQSCRQELSATVSARAVCSIAWIQLRAKRPNLTAQLTG